MLSAPGGLLAFLSTTNYTLYLLAYLDTKFTPHIRALVAKLLNRPTPPVTASTAVSPIASLGALLSSTRTTLRLLGLFPMYAWLRQLLAGPKQGQDGVLYATSLTQCLLYMGFQFLENVALLTDSKVLPTSLTEKYTAKATPGGRTGTAKIYLYAYRAWLGGILCDFVRLFREAQLERDRRAKGEVSTMEQEEVDAKWWSQAIVPMAWIPMAVQYSKESGLPGWNLGLMGLCGGVAGMGKIRDLWASTA